MNSPCPYSRTEVNRNGENTKRTKAPDSKAPLLQERRPGDRSQRDNRDNVWKRIDSRYAPRENYRQAPPTTATDKSQKEKISTSSPEHVRERPFKLTLQKRSTKDQKLKGKASDLGNISDEGSSAKKSLKFDEEKPPPISKSQASVPVLSFVKEKEKSWYEQTLEEEETMDKEILNKPDKPMEKERRRILMQKNSRGFLLISPWRNHTSWLWNGNL
ncbi:hypothetical protein Bca4012_033969 [Brassica carinata]